MRIPDTSRDTSEREGGLRGIVEEWFADMRRCGDARDRRGKKNAREFLYYPGEGRCEVEEWMFVKALNT